MGYYTSLRDYIETLESRGKLFRIQREVCRETELEPLVRWQFRGLPESERRAFLFERVASVAGRKYDMSVLSGACGSSRAIYALGMGCREEEIFDRWINAELLVIPMIEETEAVDNLDAILTVPGIDVLHVASGDLGQSMGNPGAAAVRQVMRQVIPRIRAGGKLVGVGGNSPTDAAGIAEFIKLGANLVTISALGLLRLGADDFRRRVQAAL